MPNLLLDLSLMKSTMATQDDVAAIRVDIAKMAGDVQKAIKDQTVRFITWMLGAVTLTAVLAGIVMNLAWVSTHS